MIESDLLRNRYGLVEFGENGDWVVLKEFPLPDGWNTESTEILVLIPPGYPATPPDNFFVPNGLRTSIGGMPQNFSENQSILGESWAQFSFHSQEWNPSNDITKGDSLLTFMLAVERRLKEGA